MQRTHVQGQQVYPDRQEDRYGFFRPVIRETVSKYLGCGDLKQGFATADALDLLAQELAAAETYHAGSQRVFWDDKLGEPKPTMSAKKRIGLRKPAKSSR